MNIGLQLFTIREECEKDFFNVLGQVAKIGYKGLEFAGYYNKKPEELKSKIEELGMKAVNTHVILNDLERDFDTHILYAKTLGFNTITISYLFDEERKDKEAYLHTKNRMIALSKKCEKEGITLCYHNHDFEFVKIDNKYALDFLLEMEGNLQLELDTFWSSFAKIDTLEYMESHKKKLVYVHIKDMLSGDKPRFAEVGEGILDITSILKKANDCNVEWVFVEQDICEKNPMESIAISYNNAKKIIDLI